jgi:hypothetical protein
MGPTPTFRETVSRELAVKTTLFYSVLVLAAN